jgi:zinc D-Ala-D-Ala carboxypeptidase
MNLSKNFTLEAFCKTNSKYPNVPEKSDILSMSELCKNVLQPLRDLFGHEIIISSGYRSLAVNKDKGGTNKPLSQHCKGEAADLKSTDNAQLFKLIREHFVFDQMIWEGGDDNQPAWVHVSYKTQGNRGEMLRMRIENGVKQYTHIK